MTDASAGISDEERRKRSVYYQACTSPVKDDIPTLVKCLRTDQGPHNRVSKAESTEATLSPQLLILLIIAS